jgi:DNA/RNA endonuclease YhcR with UshA esterase domain
MRRMISMMGMAVMLVGGIARAETAASQPTSQPIMLDPTDAGADTAAEGKDVIVEGKIVRSAWSRSGKTMMASFSSDRTTLQLVIFAANKDDMDKAFGGDVAKTLKGATVHVEGKVKIYRSRPEIVVGKAEQLTILKAAATEPATQP